MPWINHPKEAKRTHISLIPSWLTTFNFKVPHVFWIGKRTINVSPSMKSQLDGLTVSGLLNCTEAGQSLVRKTLFFHFDAFHFKNSNTHLSYSFFSFRVCQLSSLPWLFGQYLLDRMYALLRTFLGFDFIYGSGRVPGCLCHLCPLLAVLGHFVGMFNSLLSDIWVSFVELVLHLQSVLAGETQRQCTLAKQGSQTSLKESATA